ncbi:hypothetical protein KC959_03040, partial [Candidatus Saccharibacteria bacterium]|nr:hypothetical protein [Candidatus Saccharibacteria bacterium]
GVTTKGSPSTWNAHDPSILNKEPLTPPDKQSNFIPLKSGTSGLTYYEFKWDYDQAIYRRYFVSSAHSASFDVTINVQVKSLDKYLVVRLLDRDLGQWLQHSSSCEVPISREVPPPPSPNLEVKKTILDKKTSYKPGDEYTYLIQYRNTVNASLAENVVITDELDTKNFDVVKVSPAEAKVSNGFLKLEAGNLAYSTSYREVRITVRLKDQISSGSTVCNASRMTASNAGAKDSQNVCIGVITPCPYDNSVPDINNPNCSEPKVVCSLVDAAVNLTTRKVTFRTVVESTNPTTTQVFGYNYDFGDDTPVQAFEVTGFTHETMHTYQPGDYTTRVTISYGAQGLDGKQQVDCSAPISFEEDKPVGQSKVVKNITQDKTGEAAEKTSLRPNDVLEYTLTTSNSQNYERVGIDVSDYIGDILDYASLDTAFLKEQGGTYDEKTKKIVWTDITIPANGQVLHSFRVKIKDPIPATNRPSTVATGFDCKISNEYGNEITINVNCPLVKGIETLPNTGPGSSMVMLTLITTLVGYFFARNRLLVKELGLVRTDYARTGGM